MNSWIYKLEIWIEDAMYIQLLKSKKQKQKQQQQQQKKKRCSSLSPSFPSPPPLSP
jgi:hypothetical protein